MSERRPWLRAGAAAAAGALLTWGWVSTRSHGIVRPEVLRATAACQSKRPPREVFVDPGNRARRVEGTVLGTWTGRGTERRGHRWMDVTTMLAPDPAFRGLMGSANRTLEVQRELDGLPPSAWPLAGDHVLATGDWTIGCATGERYRTKLRPASVVVSVRNRGLVDPRHPDSGRRPGILDEAGGFNTPVRIARARVFSATDARPVTFKLAPPSVGTRVRAAHHAERDAPAGHPGRDVRVDLRADHAVVTVPPGTNATVDVFWSDAIDQAVSRHTLRIDAVTLTKPLDPDGCAELHLWQTSFAASRLVSACLIPGQTMPVGWTGSVWLGPDRPAVGLVIKGFECDHGPLPCRAGRDVNDEPGIGSAVLSRDAPDGAVTITADSYRIDATWTRAPLPPVETPWLPNVLEPPSRDRNTSEGAEEWEFSEDDAGFFGTVLEVGGDPAVASSVVLREGRPINLEEGAPRPPVKDERLLWYGLAASTGQGAPLSALAGVPQPPRRSPLRLALVVAIVVWGVWVLGLVSGGIRRLRR